MIPNLGDSMLIVGMVWVTRVQKVKLGIVHFILFDTMLKLLSISCYETCGFVNDISYLKR